MEMDEMEKGNWMGYTLRGDSILRTAIEGKMEGRRTSGRPRQMMLHGLDDDRWLQKAQRRGTTTRGVATSDILTCLRGREPEEDETTNCSLDISLDYNYESII